MSTITPSRRERKKQATRDKICVQTQHLISLHGIDGTTIDAICHRTDIAKKTFYNYYKSKNDLLFNLSTLKLLNRINELIDESLDKYQSLRSRLIFTISVLKQHATNADHVENQLLCFMLANLSSNLNQNTDQLTQMNQCFLRLFQASQNDIKTPLTADFCAEITVGMINTLTLNRLHYPSYDSDFKFNQLLDYLLTSMLKDSSVGNNTL